MDCRSCPTRQGPQWSPQWTSWVWLPPPHRNPRTRIFSTNNRWETTWSFGDDRLVLVFASDNLATECVLMQIAVFISYTLTSEAGSYWCSVEGKHHKQWSCMELLLACQYRPRTLIFDRVSISGCGFRVPVEPRADPTEAAAGDRPREAGGGEAGPEPR